MVLSIPGRQTVTVLRRLRRLGSDGLPVRDPRGNDVIDSVRVDVSGCSVQPGASTEDTDDGRDQVIRRATIYAPSSWPGGVVDGVLIDDQRWDIDGEPARWHHPRLGHVVVAVKRETG